MAISSVQFVLWNRKPKSRNPATAGAGRDFHAPSDVLGSGLNLNQLSFHSANIGSQLADRQRVSADSEITGFELDPSRPRMLAVLVPVAFHAPVPCSDSTSAQGGV